MLKPLILHDSKGKKWNGKRLGKSYTFVGPISTPTSFSFSSFAYFFIIISLGPTGHLFHLNNIFCVYRAFTVYLWVFVCVFMLMASLYTVFFYFNLIRLARRFISTKTLCSYKSLFLFPYKNQHGLSFTAAIAATKPPTCALWNGSSTIIPIYTTKVAFNIGTKLLFSIPHFYEYHII